MSAARKALEAAREALKQAALALMNCANEPACNDEDEPMPRSEWCCECEAHERCLGCIAQIDAALAAPDESPADAWRRGAEAAEDAIVKRFVAMWRATGEVDKAVSTLTDPYAPPPYEPPAPERGEGGGA